MPTPTYVALAKTVLTGTQTAITFNSIPQTYTDLLLVISARSDQSASGALCLIYPNGTVTSSYTYVAGSGGSASSSRGTSVSYIRAYHNAANSTANTFSNTEIYMPNYTGSTNKIYSVITGYENNNATTYDLYAFAQLNNQTQAITSLELRDGGYPTNGFVSGSRFDLYGIKNS